MSEALVLEDEDFDLDDGDAGSDAYGFDEQLQAKILALTVRDSTFAQRTDGLIRPEYFAQDADAAVASIALSYFSDYKKAPDVRLLPTLLKDAIKAKRVRSDLVPEVKKRIIQIAKADLSDRAFVENKVVDFAQHKAIETAIVDSVGHLQRGNFDAIKKAISDAFNVGTQESEKAYSYFKEVQSRTKRRIDESLGIIKRDGITTGCADLDKWLYHNGWGRKELSVIMGAAKAGKSMSLGDFCKSAALAGFNVLYVSCEVSREIIADRIDANLSDVAIRVLNDSAKSIEAKIQAAEAKAGEFEIVDYPSGSLKVSQLRRLLEYYRSRGVIFDLIAVDYADIMCPERMNDEPRENLRTIYVDLRALAYEYNAAVLTATQTNREGAKKAVASMTEVAEDFNKVRTADILLSINATEDEVKAGEARIYFAAHRNGETGFSLRIRQDRSKMKFLQSVIGRE